jgi:hypothetical protein
MRNNWGPPTTPANMRETATCPSNHGAGCIALAGAILVTAQLIEVPPRAFAIGEIDNLTFSSRPDWFVRVLDLVSDWSQ